MKVAFWYDALSCINMHYVCCITMPFSIWCIYVHFYASSIYNTMHFHPLLHYHAFGARDTLLYVCILNDKSAEPSSAELSSAEPIVEPPMPSSAEPSVELLRPSSADVRGKRPRGKLLKTLSAEPKPRSKPLSVELIAEPPRPSSAELSSELTGPMSLELSGKKLSSAEPSAELPLSRRAPCRA